MVHRFLCLLLCLGVYAVASAQNLNTVEGTIFDSRTYKAVSGAKVRLGKMISFSDTGGNFSIQGLQDGKQILTIYRSGYQNKSFSIDIEPNMKKLVIYLIEEPKDIEEVVVHGKTKTRKERELSILSQTIDKDFLDRNRENSLMQTLDKIPGVTTMDIGSGQSKPVIRGLGFNRVSVIQNGIKHEAQQWGSDHGLEIDQYGIDEVQIIKGPVSILYGSDAIGGVVNIKSPKIPLPNSFGGDVNLLAESNNNLLGVSAGLQYRKDKWFYRSRVTYRNYGDYKVPTDRINYQSYIFELHKNRLRNTAGREANAAVSVGYVSEKVQSETFISNVNAKNGFFANAHGLEVRMSTINYDQSDRDIDYPFHEVNHFKISNTTTFLLPNSKLTIDAGFQNNYREEHSEPVPHGYMPKPEGSKERSYNKNTYSLNITDTFKVFDKHEVITGVNTEFQDNSIGGWGYLIPSYHRLTIGGFVYDKYEINPNLYLHAGLRYDYGNYKTASYFDWYPSLVRDEDGDIAEKYLQRAQDKNLNYGSVSGSLGLSYIQNQMTYKINAGKSFRMPLANELASDGVNYHMYRFEKGNLNLNPEESYQIDVDIDYSTPEFYFGISPFLNFFENFIYLNPTADFYETSQIYEYTQNKVFRAGGEAKAGVKMLKKLSLDVSGEYVYSRQTSGPKKDFTLPFSPPLSGLFTAGYEFKDFLFLKKPVVSASYKIAASQNEIVPPESITKGYQVLNLSFLSSVKTFGKTNLLDLRLKINNVFNTKYFNHTSFYRLIDVPEAGRNISISLTQHF